MKTDQKLTVKFTGGELTIFHKSMMGDLNKLFQIGNAYRLEDGLTPITLTNWVQRQDVKDYISHLESHGIIAIKKTRGRAGTTTAHLKVILDAAIALSPKLKDEVYDTFINNKMLFYRDSGGDNFIELNDAITLYAESVLGKPAHKGHFINIAKIIKKRLDVVDWNTATPHQLRERDRIESVLTTMLRTGVVKDWGHLKELTNIV